jgi:hypothetical protein
MTISFDAADGAREVQTGPDFAVLSDSAYSALMNTAATPPASSALTPWTAGDYVPTVNRSGATKLASSGVAPLVVAAGGYESVDEPASKDFAKRWGIGDGRTKRGSQFLASFRDDGDVLVMPWFSVDQQSRSFDRLVKPGTMNLQFRPEHPRKSQAGKVVKYEFLVGDDTVLDFHPAATREWTATAARVMIAEGLLKGDAALTAQLRSHGVTDEELAIADGDSDRLAAMRRLAQLMGRIPAHERVAIVSIAGVGNWRQNSEWAEIDVRDKDVLVAFDGDVVSNWNVWNMAKLMFDFVEKVKKGTPQLVNLAQNDGAMQAMFLEPSLGLDDFFNHVGDWSEIDSMIMDQFPERPDKPDDKRVGEWRVNTSGTVVEECTQVTDIQGNKAGVEWQYRYGIGGRILFSETRRGVTDEEMRTGRFGAGVNESAYDVHCAIELKWHNEINDKDVVVEVTGPHSILGYPPNEWDRRGATIPTDLMFHPEWPPKKGAEWLQAIKANEAAAIDRRTTWSTMGWVPVDGEISQAFIVGDTIVAASEDAKRRIRVGVTDRELTSASKFGVSNVYTGPGYTDPDGVHDLREDIRTVVDTYITNSPWRTQQIALSVLSMALRPAVPLPTSCAAYLVGPPGKGKSWTARQVMSFWQARPGTWEDTLPGSANDTFASTEDAVARAPIWVADDLAPSSDRKKAEMMEANIGDLIRAVFNKLGKRRMNVDMTAKEVPTPMALLILTAENEHSIQSIRERVVNIEFTGLNDANFKAADDLPRTDLAASRVTAAIIRMYINTGERKGWESVTREVQFARKNSIGHAKKLLETMGVDRNDTERPAGIVADLSLGLAALSKLTQELEMDDLIDLITWEPGGWMTLVTEQISYSHRNKKAQSPGAVLIDCIRNLLASGAGHIANIDDPSKPPATGDDSERLNSLLGWDFSPEVCRPRGLTLGRLKRTVPKGSNEPETVLFLSPDDTFNLAQQKYPKRVQYGASSNTSWKNVWDLGLVHPAYDGKVPSSGVTVQYRAGRVIHRGVPISIDTLFPDDERDEGGEKNK